MECLINIATGWKWNFLYIQLTRIQSEADLIFVNVTHFIINNIFIYKICVSNLHRKKYLYIIVKKQIMLW